MSPNPTDNSSPRVLLVEGSDDLHVVLHLCMRSETMPKFHIIDRGGKDNLLKTVNEEIDVSDRAAVGILVDADNDLAKRWKKIKRKLQENNIALPDKPEPSGTITAGVPRRHPRIGIWIMPDNQSPGELEDFIVKMIPTGDPVWPRSESYIDGIPEDDRKFKGKILKAKVHAWLAAREEPRKMGLAITAEDLDISGTTCMSFVAWLRKLFT